MAGSWSSAPTRGTSSARADAPPSQGVTTPARTASPVGDKPTRATPGRRPGPYPGRGRGSGVYDLLDTKENCPQMARLVGVDLPREKRLEVALTYVSGHGRARALATLQGTGGSGARRD